MFSIIFDYQVAPFGILSGEMDVPQNSDFTF